MNRFSVESYTDDYKSLKFTDTYIIDFFHYTSPILLFTI